ncbi:hypothetical protein SYNPS1DRAFT_25632 [Syncephalis pseudoplumigaleata]|uniref:Uncharacterized protein n=1 Tax=Syncephalis pseudoplumigaleata TaxID=1712513 RepID=A0A4P9YUM6_9FUNG|nr:hypothetical protein SYNPS1DRAFT_25632 [Syncephalis pseudoplumigaleata]|eukprot:RKP22580.1 hypothetical protein SYNPS1DRAFT_25632 [Syncephalis pseudoplumigaleata]
MASNDTATPDAPSEPSNATLQQRIAALEEQLVMLQQSYEEKLDSLRERYRVDMTCEEGELTEASTALEHAQHRIDELQHAVRKEYEMQRNSARAHELLVEEIRQELNQQRNQHAAAEQQWTEERSQLQRQIQQLEAALNRH